MILVDTSVWIEFFRSRSKLTFSDEIFPQLAVCNPIIQEVLQGISDNRLYERIRASMLSFPILSPTLTVEHYLEAANIYRSGRQRGLTIRSSIDCLIAAVAIREGVAVWHRDRDFNQIAKFTDLKIH